MLAQIDWLRRRRIHVHEECENTWKEMRAWQWMKRAKGEEWEDMPAEGFDDAMAALRYGIEGWRRKRYRKQGGKSGRSRAPKGSAASGRNSDPKARCETSDEPDRAKRDD